MPRRCLRLAGVLAIAPAWASAQILLGPEFQANTYTTSSQGAPSVASDGPGNFVVVWQDTSNNGIFARRFDASGTPLGNGEFRVNAYTSGGHLQPSVTAVADGRIVVVWNASLQDGSGWGVFGRRFDGDGTPGPEFQVNSFTTLGQQSPSIGSDVSGNFVVTWIGFGPGGDGIFARRFAAAGTPLGEEFLVSSYTTAQGTPQVAVAADGRFVVIWERWPGGVHTHVVGQLHDATGARVGGEFPVSTHPTGIKNRSAVAMDAGGNFVVAWSSYAQDGGGAAVVGRRFDAAGVPQGGEFIVNSYRTGNQAYPRVASEPDGRFVVVWESAQDGGDRGIFARRFDATAAPDGPEFQVNTYTTGAQLGPDIALAGGSFVAAWSSMGQDGSSHGVFGQRFAPDLIFRDGFDAGTVGAWSAASTDGGDLGVSTLAAMKLTTAGLRAQVDDTAALYVQDDTPHDEGLYRARFYFDTNGFDPGEAQQTFRTRLFIVFEENPTRRLAAVVLRRQAGAYSLRGRLRKADGSQLDTPFVPISDGPHVVEIGLRAADGSPGWLGMAVDGTGVAFMLQPEGSPHFVDFVRMGALSVKAGASGTLYFDEFESRRAGAIGP